jgi:hypothetical protein
VSRIHARGLLRTLEELLLQLSLGDLNLDRLVDLLLVSALVVGIVLDGGGEQRVDEGRLAESRLAGNLKRNKTWSTLSSIEFGDALLPCREL